MSGVWVCDDDRTPRVEILPDGPGYRAVCVVHGELDTAGLVGRSAAIDWAASHVDHDHQEAA